MRFEQHHPAEPAFRHDVLHGDEVAGVAAILVHRHDPALLLRDLHEILCVGERRRERLVDHDVTSREQALLCDYMM